VALLTIRQKQKLAIGLFLILTLPIWIIPYAVIKIAQQRQMQKKAQGRPIKRAPALAVNQAQLKAAHAKADEAQAKFDQAVIRYNEWEKRAAAVIAGAQAEKAVADYSDRTQRMRALLEQAQAALPPNYGLRSPDGRWWWDGQEWLALTPPKDVQT
jgi:hypothetical protein